MITKIERARKIRECYRIMSNVMQNDIYTFMSYIKDGRDILQSAKQLIIRNNAGFVRTTKVANGLYAWFENEYNNIIDTYGNDNNNIEQKVILNFMTVLNRIVSLELLQVQFTPFTKVKSGMNQKQIDECIEKIRKEKEFFVLYANDEINDIKDINKKALTLHPLIFFEQVYDKVLNIMNKLPIEIRNATIDYTYKSAEQYEYYF